MSALTVAIVTRLRANATVADLVGTRIHPSTAPSTSRLSDKRARPCPQVTVGPYITYEVTGEERHPHQTAASGLIQSRIQLDIWAATASARDAVADAVRLALDAYRGTIDSFKVERIDLEDAFDGFEQPDDGSDAGTFVKTMDFSVWHRESIPSH